MALQIKSSLVLIASLIITACNNKTPDEALADARSYVQSDNIDAATIELKNAISDNPENPSLRYQLGEIYFSQGRLTAAEKEFRFALRTGYEPNDVVPKLAETLSLQYKSSDVIELASQVNGLSPGADTTLRVLAARAHILLDQKDEALQQIRIANERANETLYSGYANALESYSNEDVDGALKALEEILASDPGFTHALLLQGQLYSALGENSKALESFRKYKAALPDLIFARIYFADALIKNDQFEQAKTEVESLLKAIPNSGYVNQLRAQIAYAENNFSDTRLYAEKAINYGANNTVSRSLAGIAAYSLGNYELARHHLAPVIDRLPPNNPIHGIYAAILVQMGSVEADERGYESLKLLKESNPALLIDTGYQLVKQGQADSARELISVIDAASIEDPGQIARLSLLKLSLNDEQGLILLESALQEEPDNQRLQLSLVQAKLGTGNTEEALTLAKEYTAQNPGDIHGWNMLGVVHTKAKDYAGAASAHQNALNIDNKDLTSLVFFAKNAIRKGNEQEALNYYRRIAARDELYFPGIASHYVLEKKLGDPNKLLDRLKTFHELGNNHQATLVYARFLAEEDKNDLALAVLEEYKPNSSTPSSFWILKVDLFKQIGEMEKLEPFLVEWTRAEPKNGLAWRSIASYYESIGDVNKAAREVENGLNTATSELDNLKVLAAQYAIQRQETDKAERIIADLIKTFGDNNPVVSLLRGQLLLSKEQYSNAIPLLKHNYDYRPSDRSLKLILNAMVRLKQNDKAIEFTQQHINANPNSATAWLYLANLQMRADNMQAIDSYQQVLAIEPHNRIALNNTVALLNENNRAKQAITLIESVLDDLKREPFIFELYASALWKDGQRDAALKQYAHAFELSNKSTKYAKFYADALVESGQAAYAKRILSEAR